MTHSTVRIGAFFEGQWSTRTWEEGFPITPKDDIALLEASGVKVVCLQAYEVYQGQLYYKSKKYPQLSCKNSSGFDFLGEYIKAAKDKGMEVWVWSSEKGMPRGSILYNKFQDCLELDQNGCDNSSWDHNYPSMCINSPWRQFLKDIYSEILTTYPIDGIIVSDESGFNDAVRWGGYCSYCSDLFKKETGEQPPIVPEWDDKNSLWWRFLRMKMNWWAEYIEDLAQTCKNLRPHVKTAVIINENVLYSTLKSLDWWQIYEIPALDIIGSDTYYRIFTQDHATHLGFIGDFMTAMNKGRKKSFLTTPAYRTIGPADIRLGALNAALSGVDDVFFYNLGYIRDYSDKRQAVQQVTEVVSELNNVLEGAVPYKYAGVTFSRREWMGHFAPNAEHLLAESIGLYQALNLSGVPTNVVGDDILLCEKQLNEYKVVFLPQLFEVTKELVQNLRSYITRGGCLVITLLEKYISQDPASLELWKEVFGVDLVGETTAAVSYLRGKEQLSNLSHEVFQWPIVQHTTFGGYPAVDRRRMILKVSKPYNVLFENQTMDGQSHEAIISKPIGEGRLIISTEDLGSSISALMAKGWGCESLWLFKALNLSKVIRALALTKDDTIPFTIKNNTPNMVTKLFEKEKEYILVLINHEIEKTATVNLDLYNSTGVISKKISVNPADVSVVTWKK